MVTVAANGEVTDAQVAAYLAKYATKSTEATGHTSNRLDVQTVGLYADPQGSHTERLIAACWRLGRASGHASTDHGHGLRAFRAYIGPAEPTFGPLRTDPECGGCTRYRMCPTCAAEQAEAAAAPQPTQRNRATDPAPRLRRWAHMLGFGGHFLTKSRRYSITFAFLRDARVTFRRNESNGPATDVIETAEPTVLVVNFLDFVGAGWQTPADAMLANTSAAMAREHQQTAREYLHTRAA